MSVADQYEQQMLALINAERANVGLQPLTLNAKLNSSAETHSEWMLERDIFSHTGVNGSSAGDRMQTADYRFEGNWAWGENIAWASQGGAVGISDEVANMHIRLMASQSHKDNILNADFKQIGIGIEVGMFTDADGRTYTAVMITQNFALSAADNGGDGGSGSGTSSGGGTTPVVVAPPVATEAANKLTGTANADTWDGLGGNDIISGLGGNDTLVGGLGNDKLYGGDNDDDLLGGLGNDFLQGDLGDDFIFGGDGNDKAYGGDGQDTLSGGVGNDNLFGGIGNDELDGGIGNDRLYGEADNDTLDGGDGADRLDGGDGDDDLNGGSENDRLAGGNGNDLLLGGTGNDRLSGDFGDDILDGGEGDDRLNGGDGNDILSGGAGIDRLAGGLGEDTFVFVDGFGTDRVDGFVNDVDTLVFADSYWDGIEDAASFVDTYAVVAGSKVVFDFGDGDIVTVSGVASLELLYDDVMRIA